MVYNKPNVCGEVSRTEDYVFSKLLSNICCYLKVKPLLKRLCFLCCYKSGGGSSHEPKVFNTTESTAHALLVATGGRSALFSTNTGVFKLELSFVSVIVSYFIDRSCVKVMNCQLHTIKCLFLK
jgi:hypothetical protein